MTAHRDLCDEHLGQCPACPSDGPWRSDDTTDPESSDTEFAARSGSALYASQQTPSQSRLFDGDRENEVLTPGEASHMLKVPERTLADWRYRQKGPPFHRIGRHVRYLANEVRAWLACQ